MANIGTVLITGATGRVGKVAIKLLSQSGRAKVRVAVRDPSKTGEMLKGLGAHEVVKWDMTDNSTWGPAIDGVDAVLSSSDVPLIEEHKKWAKFLGTKKSQLKHVVRIGCMGAETNTASYDPKGHVSLPDKEVPYQLLSLWHGEECLIAEGLPVTAVRGNFFMNHLMKNEGDNIQNHGFMELPLGDCKNSFVCPNDMGEAAATCLLDGPEAHANKFYDICGPVPQSMYEVAEDLSKAMGKKVEYRAMDPVEWEKNFGAVRALFRTYLRNGFYTRCSPHFYNLTGRKPTTYYDYLTKKGPHGETGLEELFAKTGHVFAKGVDHYAKVK
jgi:uncharacterized protein YbjT (DUF2867 family)